MSFAQKQTLHLNTLCVFYPPFYFMSILSDNSPSYAGRLKSIQHSKKDL